MKKRAFSLMEILISLGIIGIITALVLPNVMGNKPSDVKMKYIKTYNTITTLTEEIINNSNLYYQNVREDDGSTICDGTLACTDISRVNASLRTKYNLPAIGTDSTNNKFPLIFASHLDLNGGITQNGNVCTFATTDGTAWSFNTTVLNGAVTGINLQIDIDPDENRGEFRAGILENTN